MEHTIALEELGLRYCNGCIEIYASGGIEACAAATRRAEVPCATAFSGRKRVLGDILQPMICQKLHVHKHSLTTPICRWHNG